MIDHFIDFLNRLPFDLWASHWQRFFLVLLHAGDMQVLALWLVPLLQIVREPRPYLGGKLPSVLTNTQRGGGREKRGKQGLPNSFPGQIANRKVSLEKPPPHLPSLQYLVPSLLCTHILLMNFFLCFRPKWSLFKLLMKELETPTSWRKKETQMHHSEFRFLDSVDRLTKKGKQSFEVTFPGSTSDVLWKWAEAKTTAAALLQPQTLYFGPGWFIVSGPRGGNEVSRGTIFALAHELVTQIHTKKPAGTEGWESNLSKTRCSFCEDVGPLPELYEDSFSELWFAPDYKDHRQWKIYSNFYRI